MASATFTRILSLAALSCAALGACNLIVGVHDVKLRKDSGPDRDGDIIDLPPEDEDAGPEPPRFIVMALGRNHSCAKRRSGQVRCWGDDSAGQTGTGGKLAEPNEAGIRQLPVPGTVENVNAFTVASGADHTCVAQVDGTVSCWGTNVVGQLGTGNNTAQASSAPVRNIVDAVALAAGSSHTCALRRGGQMACWGQNGTGQLGIGTFTPSNIPAPVDDLTEVKAMALGQSHTCAVTVAGDVYCWGENYNGQLGLAPGERQARPRKSTATGAIAIAASNDTTCAILATGGIVCWGKDDVGQTGKGTVGSGRNGTPSPVPGVEGATAIAGGGEHFCAINGQNVVFCWGANTAGQLGQGRADAGDAAVGTPIGRPQAVPGITAASVGAGGFHSCATTADDAVYCWGDNGRGALGDGTGRSSSTPVAVTGYP